MRRTLTLVTLTIMLGFQCCNFKSAKESSKNSEITPNALKGYFIKNSFEFTADCMTAVIKDESSFNQQFGMAKTMDNTITKPHFEKNYIAAIMLQPSNAKREVRLTEYQLSNGILTINYEIQEQGTQNDFLSSGLSLFEIPRTVNSVKFICGEQVDTINL